MKPTDQERVLTALGKILRKQALEYYHEEYKPMTQPSSSGPSFTFTFTGGELVFLISTLTDPLWFEDGDGEDSFKRLRTDLIKRLEKAYLDD